MFKALKQKIATFIHKPVTVLQPKEFVPFDLMVGSHLKIDTNSHVIYKSRCTIPNTNTVTSIGICVLGGAKAFRFYFNNSHFLQVITNQNKQIEECRLFALIDVVYPSTMVAWDMWLNDGKGRIGSFEFKLDHSDLVYTRMSSWADDELDWVPPVTFTEVIKGANEVSITHQAMSYGRWLNEDRGIAEYLLVSSDSSQHEENICTYIGIDVNLNEVITYF